MSTHARYLCLLHTKRDRKMKSTLSISFVRNQGNPLNVTRQISSQALPRKGEPLWFDHPNGDSFMAIVTEVSHELDNGIIKHSIFACVYQESTVVRRNPYNCFRMPSEFVRDNKEGVWLSTVVWPYLKKQGFVLETELPN